MENDIDHRKELVRRKMKSVRSKLPRLYVLSKSSEIQKLLFDLLEFKHADTVCFYVAKGNEVQTRQMINGSLNLGKRVLVPITDAKTGGLLLSELRNFDSELESGTFGVLEPKSEFRRIVSPAEVQVIFVPGVAFDLCGHRLGYGKGCYDKLLREVSLRSRNSRFIGLAYEFQILENIPHGSDDVPVHKILTEKRIVVPDLDSQK